MDTATDNRIEAFRVSVERLDTITGQLQTLAITLARADELPGMIAETRYPGDLQRLKEEQAAIGHPLRLRIRQSQLENDLRQGWRAVGEQLRVATDAATAHVTTAAGGPEAARRFPFARRHLEELARHRNLPATAGITASLAFLNSAWLAIDAAMASLGEIRFDARRSRVA